MNKTILAIAFIALISCEDGQDGLNGLNSLINTTEEVNSSNCEFGGVKIQTGIDLNSNNILEENEIDKTDFVCNAEGFNSLINTTTEVSGVNCSNGGLKVETGIDLNRNNILEENEIQKIDFICNGIDFNPDAD